MRRGRLLVGLVMAACGAGGGAPVDGSVDDAGTDGGGGCPRQLAAADRARPVLISRPYDAQGEPSPRFEVLSLSQSGELSTTGAEVALERATQGEIAFTPDGEIAVAVGEDGGLGVVRFTAGAAEVVHAGFRGSFYAGRVTIAASGDLAYVVDPNTADNGGGIYRVAIACDGSLTDLGRWIPARSPGGLHLVDGDGLLIADQALDSPLGDEVMRIAMDGPRVLATGDAFGDDAAIYAGSVVTANRQHLLVGDAKISGNNRVASVSLGGLLLDATLAVDDPIAIVASPFDDAALVVSGFGDAAYVLDYTPTASPAVSLRGELGYQGASPQLPSGAVLVGRGSLNGLVLVSENQGVRRIRFEGGGEIADLGLTGLGSGLAGVVGAIGIAP